MNTPPPILGWIVLRRDDGRWLLDLDGEVHPTLDAGQAAEAQARAAGHQAILVAAHWVRRAGGDPR